MSNVAFSAENRWLGIAEQWPVEALPVLWSPVVFRSHLPDTGQRDSFPATLNSIGHQRHALFPLPARTLHTIGPR